MKGSAQAISTIYLLFTASMLFAWLHGETQATTGVPKPESSACKFVDWPGQYHRDLFPGANPKAHAVVFWVPRGGTVFVAWAWLIDSMPHLRAPRFHSAAFPVMETPKHRNWCHMFSCVQLSQPSQAELQNQQEPIKRGRNQPCLWRAPVC